MTLPSLMLVTDRRATRGRPLLDVVAAAARGGLRLVQVRERGLDDEAVAALCRRIARLGVTVLVNGRPAVARALGIGLHLPAAAPLPDLAGVPLFGRAVHDAAEAARAAAEGAAYAVAGTVYPTASKPGRPAAGPALLTAVRRAFAAPRPLYAIGGITPRRVPEVIGAGATGVAVRSGILAARDPSAATRALRDALAACRGAAR